MAAYDYGAPTGYVPRAILRLKGTHQRLALPVALVAVALMIIIYPIARSMVYIGEAGHWLLGAFGFDSRCW